MLYNPMQCLQDQVETIPPNYPHPIAVDGKSSDFNDRGSLANLTFALILSDNHGSRFLVLIRPWEAQS